ncbi:MAG TPA: hypothetical protein VMG60_15940 [Burkholderiaceae bacterium]|nr:hypothetical protein [Burkholderiaceae bacterium]
MNGGKPGDAPTGSPVAPAAREGSARLQFQCRNGIACWNGCCGNIDISLTPFDMVGLTQRLDLASTEFLHRYTVPYAMQKDGIAGVKLRPVDGGTACRFPHRTRAAERLAREEEDGGCIDV